MNREKQIIKISIIGIFVNLILVAFKATVGLIAGSISIVLDALNNLSDALSAIITIIGTVISGKRPDKNHPYGHGRVEYIASTAVALIVFAAGITALVESVQKVIEPQMAEYSVATIVIVSVAVLVKFFFGRYVRQKGKELNSSSLVATGTDAVSDAALSFSTLVGIFISLVFHVAPEGYIGIIISAMILKAAIEILKSTINDLLGVRADEGLTNKLKKSIAKIDPQIQGVYDLAVHNYGPNKIVGSAHIQVDDTLTARDIHHLTKRIEYGIYEKYGIILTIGIYASNDSGKFKDVKDYLKKLIKQYPHILQMHGFYVDEGLKTISFDLIFDFDELKPEEKVAEIKQKMQEKYPDFSYAVIIDTDVTG
ncbi:cation diffusion facilitator family transporter [Candidatus Saccharibacteria bacterium]|nr:cation diffusion facilitator family transporter [Candidatus Saccharibacteria bacterium]